MDWSQAASRVAAQVVRIETPDGWGSGFVIAASPDSPIRTVGTAFHVFEPAIGHEFHIASGKQSFTAGGESRKDSLYARVDELDAVTVILLNMPGLPIPTVPFLERGEAPLAVGMEVGWLGFPQIHDDLCFFSGRVSAIINDDHFLVDGTAIHGVSGGPAFLVTDNGPKIVGSITAYVPNKFEDDTLPGLSLVTHAAVHRDIAVDIEPDGERRSNMTITNRFSS